MQPQSNFAFLADSSPRLARLGTLAERYFADDAPTALIKLRKFGEFMAKDVAARHALLPTVSVSFDEVLRTLRVRSVLPRDVAELLFHLKRLGNLAAHEDQGRPADALGALKVARQAALWFHRTYEGAPNFQGGPFLPPIRPGDATEELRAEIERLRETVQTSGDAEARARLEVQAAEAARQSAEAAAEEARSERQFWEAYASETEAGLRKAELALANAQSKAQATPAIQLDLLNQAAFRQADKIELDESTTRVLIDEQLRAAGWIVDSTLLRHASGTRPKAGEAIAIAETWAAAIPKRSLWA